MHGWRDLCFRASKALRGWDHHPQARAAVFARSRVRGVKSGGVARVTGPGATNGTHEAYALQALVSGSLVCNGQAAPEQASQLAT